MVKLDPDRKAAALLHICAVLLSGLQFIINEIIVTVIIKRKSSIFAVPPKLIWELQICDKIRQTKL